MLRIKLMDSVLALLIFGQILYLLLHQGKFGHWLSEEAETDKVHLLILSTWRSGSSLVGQFFSQHPNVFYMMEPSWHVWRTLSGSNARVLHMAVRDLLQSVLKCDMSVFDAYMKGNRKVLDLFFWYASRALCTLPACDKFPNVSIVNATACSDVCGNDPFEKVEQVCGLYRCIVVKEVRLFDLKVLYPLLKDPSLNLKILHLVRDPRAVARSRMQVVKELDIDSSIVLNTKGTKINDSEYDVLHEICQSHAEMFKMATNDPPPFLKGRYMLLRYEDLVQDTLRKVQEIYKFASLEATDKLVQWIIKILHGQGLPKSNEAFDITSRNALNVSQAWRNMLPFQAVKEIQDVCMDAMNSFGYKFIFSRAQQEDWSLNLLLPRLQF
ncbi:carbohydrate sulfotransferase 5-like [Hyperolius riggenbachi]|uniref:carbohydrate sulfotransferase 5-like n=1 Tax=Hyperolius riggenbachi TaxID=752182 RepID=UPI0035A2D9EC